MPAKTAQDFNYKVALASGLKSLKAGRLRQAEEQFRYLTQKFPGVDGGYRGLAKVLIELEDRPAAVDVLRDGASAMAKHGARDGAISLLREAIELDPQDLSTHRRLVAALALAGDEPAAVDEVRRFVRELEATGDSERARGEIAYALERLGPLPALHELAAARGITQPAVGAAAPQDDAPAATWDAPQVEAEVLAAPEPEPEPEPATAAEAEERAVQLIVRRDPGASRAALAAARAHLADGRTSAASDLLLHLVATNHAEHEAQLLLVDVAKAIGRSDVARAKCTLLARVLRLAGRDELAGEVERIAQAV